MTLRGKRDRDGEEVGPPAAPTGGARASTTSYFYYTLELHIGPGGGRSAIAFCGSYNTVMQCLANSLKEDWNLHFQLRYGQDAILSCYQFPSKEEDGKNIRKKKSKKSFKVKPLAKVDLLPHIRFSFCNVVGWNNLSKTEKKDRVSQAAKAAATYVPNNGLAVPLPLSGNDLLVTGIGMDKPKEVTVLHATTGSKVKKDKKRNDDDIYDETYCGFDLGAFLDVGLEVVPMDPEACPGGVVPFWYGHIISEPEIRSKVLKQCGDNKDASCFNDYPAGILGLLPDSCLIDPDSDADGEEQDLEDRSYPRAIWVPYRSHYVGENCTAQLDHVQGHEDFPEVPVPLSKFFKHGLEGMVDASSSDDDSEEEHTSISLAPALVGTVIPESLMPADLTENCCRFVSRVQMMVLPLAPVPSSSGNKEDVQDGPDGGGAPTAGG